MQGSRSNPILHYLGRIWRLIRRISLTAWIFIGMLLGLIVGLVWTDFALGLKPFREIFLHMVKTLVTPLIFSTLVVGIAGHSSDLKVLGRLAVKSLVYFELVTTVALFIGLGAVNLMKPGEGVDLGAADEDDILDVVNANKERKEITWGGILLHIFPESFYKAAADNEVLQVVFCALTFAVAIVLVPHQKARTVMVDFCESLSHIMFKVTSIVMYYTPIAVFSAIAWSVAKQGPGVLLALLKLIGTLYAALVVFVVLCLLPIVLIARLPLRRLFRAVSQPVLIAFTTSASEAALPLAMKNMERFGVPKSFVAFIMPTGYSFNLDGTTLYLAMASVFAAQTGGIEMSLSEQLIMMLTLMLTSKGVAAVPRASLVILSGALTQFNLPLEAIALIVGGDQIMDMARTSVNLLGNCLATAVIARWEGQLDLERDFDVDPDDEIVNVDADDAANKLEEGVELISHAHSHH